MSSFYEKVERGLKEAIAYEKSKRFPLPKYWEDQTPPPKYYAPVDYSNPSQCPFDLPALSRYAKEQGRAIAELTHDEVEQFRVENSDSFKGP